MPQAVFSKERRKHPRRELRQPAQIGLNESGEIDSAVYCLVENISEGGAKLAAKTTGLPDKFSLVLAPAVQRNCVVIWRSSHYLGVKFVQDRPNNVRTSGKYT